MKTCIACSMPLHNPEEIGIETADGSVCIHCTGPDGKIRSCEEIFEGGVQFFIAAAAITDRTLAEKIVRKNMKKLPYWQNQTNDCLNGEEATDEEFAAAMSKL